MDFLINRVFRSFIILFSITFFSSDFGFAKPVKWLAYNDVFKGALAIQQNKNGTVKKQVVSVNLPENFIKQNDFITLEFQLSTLMILCNKKHGSDYCISPYVQVNKKIFSGNYFINAEGNFPKYQAQIRIKKKHLKSGINTFGFFFKIRKESFVCSNNNCGYVISNLKIKEAYVGYSLFLESTPQGADVLIDGIIRGKTPCTITGLNGSYYELEFHKNGYKSQSKKIFIKQKNAYQILLELEP